MTRKKHLIIGCGSAALAALETIRSVANGDEIKVVTAEGYIPYSPTALPYLLSGRIKEDNLWMRPPSYFARLNATFETGRKAIQIIPEQKEVCFADGSKERYDTLLIATGAEPARPAIKGLEGTAFQGFRTLDDYKRLLQKLEGKRTVSILGAGLVGMEVAMGLVERGYQVHVVARSRILRAYFDVEAETAVRKIFESRGVAFTAGRDIDEVRMTGDKTEISLRGGDCVVADVVVTAMGVNPRVELAQGSGIAVNNGILVDKSMQTSIEGVFAAGDVAEAFDFFTGKPALNPIIPSAIAQGKVAGAAMVRFGTNAAEEEATETYEGSIPMNSFNFFGNVAFSVGLAATTDSRYEVLKEHDAERGQFRKLVFEGDRLVGAMMLNASADPGIFHYLIKNRVDLRGYKEAIFDNPKDVGRYLMLKAERGELVLAAD